MSILEKYKNFDVVIMGMFRWDGPYSSISIALAKEFAKTNRVFYINHPYSYKDDRTILSQAGKEERRKKLKAGQICYEKDPKQSELFTSVFLPLTIPINFLPKGFIYNCLYNYNNRKVEKAIGQVIKDQQIKQYIYINCFDPYFAPILPPRLGAALNIYQCVDDITQEAYIARHGLRLENQAVAAADLTLVTSQELYNLKAPYTDHIAVLNNAADISHFKQAADHSFVRPAELANTSQKIIGYFGNLDSMRIDYPLLKNIAEQYPDMKLLLIGPLNNEEYKEIGLDQMDNVILAGPKHISELPAYLHYFDCAIIPFLCNTLTRSIYPLKINEYLSAGKPVISTPFSEDIKGFEEFIYLSNGTKEHFVQLIKQAIKEDSKDKIKARIDLAGTNTWSARVEQFWTLVDQQLEKKQSTANV